MQKSFFELKTLSSFIKKIAIEKHVLSGKLEYEKKTIYLKCIIKKSLFSIKDI
jgi:hypothetical protein